MLTELPGMWIPFRQKPSAALAGTSHRAGRPAGRPAGREARSGDGTAPLRSTPRPRDPRYAGLPIGWASAIEVDGEGIGRSRSGLTSAVHLLSVIVAAALSFPRRTPAPEMRRIVPVRWKQRLGPVATADRVGVAPSTAQAVQRRCRISRLSHVDRVTGEPIPRYERVRPGELIHVDVKKLGNIPEGGGWRYVAASRATAIGPRPRADRAAAITTRRWAPRSCTP